MTPRTTPRAQPMCRTAGHILETLRRDVQAKEDLFDCYDAQRNLFPHYSAPYRAVHQLAKHYFAEWGKAGKMLAEFERGVGV